LPSHLLTPCVRFGTFHVYAGFPSGASHTLTTATPLKFPASSILVIRMSGIGDVLWSTPLLANLRRAYPGAHIAYVARPFCAPVLRNNPDVDEVLLFERETLRWQAGFLRRLARRRFDISIDLICSPATAIQGLVSGARVRIGYDFRVRRLLYTHVLSRHEANRGHEVEFNLFALRALELPVTTTDLVWRVSDAEAAWAAEAWKDMGIDEAARVVGLMPTGGFASKKWPAERYAALAAAAGNATALPVEARLPGDLRFLVLWKSDAERAEAQRIVDGSHGRAFLAPPCDLRGTAALLTRCAAVVGNDSGPLHVATALHVPVVALYGPTNPAAQGPWGARARAVCAEDVDGFGSRKTDLTDPILMSRIGLTQVAAALRDALEDTTA
jgi:lipopolysaccharide heptosyltransferase II